MEMTEPRIAPGTPRQIGRLNSVIVRVLALGTGGVPANIFTTLARHRRLFRRWLSFASGLMPGGRLPRADGELLILCTARNCDCEYEWRHHETIGQAAGLSAEQIASLREPTPDPALWPPERQRLLIRAADQLHATHTIDDALWDALANQHDERELIEICMLVGHYAMLAMTLNALQVQPDRVAAAGGGSLASRLAGRVLARGGRAR
jgi:alkylhydroperoxidase family enzyme